MKKMNYKGFDIEIEQDTDAESPRDWDNLGTMWCWHNRYHLGDWDDMPNGAKYITRYSDEDPVVLARTWIKNKNPVITMPLYLFDHSGLSISTRPYSCHWDSGQVGYIFITREAVFREYGWKRITKQRREQLEEILIAEVDQYDTYLKGDVWGYIISRHDQLDSCWGYYGYAYCLDEAKSFVDYLVAKEEDDKVNDAVRGFVRACRQDAINSMTSSMFI